MELLERQEEEGVDRTAELFVKRKVENKVIRRHSKRDGNDSMDDGR